MRNTAWTLSHQRHSTKDFGLKGGRERPYNQSNQHTSPASIGANLSYHSRVVSPNSREALAVACCVGPQVQSPEWRGLYL